METKNRDLDAFISSMHLSEVPKPGEHLALPQELIEVVAGVSVKGDVSKNLSEAMTKIAAVSSDVDRGIKDMKEILMVELSLI